MMMKDTHMTHQKGTVEIWEETVVIPTYEVGEPDCNPMFLEKRVYQGSSGKVYPYPVIDKIYDEKKDKEYSAVFLENDYLKIMFLPALGGRIQRAYDKTNKYDFVYYNEVIKPALVGLLGPWVSGGIEFNWPQHHRPTTFLPVDYTFEVHADGSKCLKISEVDQMYGTKGMTVFTLYPDCSYLEVKGQLYNRTDFPQTFLWWANPAVAVNDYTQSIFPPDVHAVMDHGKRDVSKFPIATGIYYKHDYSHGVDISRYKNLVVPTSYMAYHSDYDFVGGYDYQIDAGIMHVADHHIAPGKKQWTWGCGDFGKAWDRNLTDENGPYIELMTGVYTDNQPDFTWLSPYEEKTFTQYFLPYKKVSDIKNATKELLLNFKQKNDFAYLGLYASVRMDNLFIEVSSAEKILYSQGISIAVAEVFEVDIPLLGVPFHACLVQVYDKQGILILHYQEKEPQIEELPAPAVEVKEPKEVRSCEELYLIGQHLEQYRHATFDPQEYYLEGLQRDPLDSRLNNAYGLYLLRNGQIEESEQYFRKALERLTWLTPNPYDGEPFSNLGFSLMYQGREDEAYDAFFKATWNAGQRSVAYFQLACIATKRKAYEEAKGFVARALETNSRNPKAHCLQACLLIKQQQRSQAYNKLMENLEIDSFDYSSRFVLAKEFQDTHDALLRLMHNRLSSFIECSLDFANFGFYDYAFEMLSLYGFKNPMHSYYLAYYAHQMGDFELRDRLLLEGGNIRVPYCFPNTVQDLLVLKFVLSWMPEDGYAWYFLGNLLYDKKQYTKAKQAWETSSSLIAQFATVWRNLALVYYNKERDPEKALEVLTKAFELNMSDARVFYELDQLHKILGMDVQRRIQNYDAFPHLWNKRDDLYTERVTLLNLAGRSAEAYELIMHHIFHPWEGGEGKITTQYAASLKLMALDIMSSDPHQAKALLRKALQIPLNLGEGKLEGAKENDIHYLLGLCEEALGAAGEAAKEFTLATVSNGSLSSMMYYNDQPADMILYEGLALKKLGKMESAHSRFNKLIDYGEAHYFDKVSIDYFAVSLPELQLFDVDLTANNRIHCEYLIALGNIGLGNSGYAQDLLLKIIEKAPSHFGAVYHKRMYKSLLFE